MTDMEEFSFRVGEGTVYAATATCLPFEEEVYDSIEWMGYLKFDDNRFNLKSLMTNYDGQEVAVFDDWKFPGTKSGGTYLANLLTLWHSQFVELFKALTTDPTPEDDLRYANGKHL